MTVRQPVVPNGNTNPMDLLDRMFNGKVVQRTYPQFGPNQTLVGLEIVMEDGTCINLRSNILDMKISETQSKAYPIMSINQTK